MDFNIVENALSFLEEPILFDFDPEVILNGKEKNVALEIGQEELIF